MIRYPRSVRNYHLAREVVEMGAVRAFRAEVVDSGASVLLKAVRVRGDDDLPLLAAAVQQGRLTPRVEHPNVWRLRELFLEERTGYVTLDWGEAETLRHLQSIPLEFARIKLIVQQAAMGLLGVHAWGQVYGHLNPENIFVGREDAVKLRAPAELVLTRALQASPIFNTLDGFRHGTPLYLAPEQVLLEGADARVDVYALGAVLYELVTGRPPFQGDSLSAIATKRLREAARAPTALNPDLPSDWELLILTAMARDPDERFETAGDLADAIGRLSCPRSTGEPAVRSLTDEPPLKICPDCGQGGKYVFCSTCGAQLPD